MVKGKEMYLRGLLLCMALWLGMADAAVESVLILHTTDIHDHIRPGYNGAGGLPYMAGYIQSVREKEPEVLVLDAGDVTEKGDMVAFVTGMETTYRAMSLMGYDAVTMGNHDNDADLETLHRYEKALGQKLLCLNRVDDNGRPLFPGSRIVEAGEIRVGIIGIMIPLNEGTLDRESSGRALDRESRKLRDQVDLIIALCHDSVEACSQWSLAAPEVDLFVTGHSHKPIPEPVQVPETGAWLVQSGPYAQSVGRLELKVDTMEDKVVGISGHLVPMSHDTIKPNQEMIDWVIQLEAEHCPDASRHLLDNSSTLTREDLAWLGAEAIRKWSGAEIAFCHAKEVMRSTLPRGPVDVNAVFLTGGFRAHQNYKFTLTGREIESYIEALMDTGNTTTSWSGFTAHLVRQTNDDFNVLSDLDPDRLYRVVMPKAEFRSRLMRMASKHRERSIDSPLVHLDLQPQDAGLTFTEAMSSYLDQLTASNLSLKEVADRIRTGYGPTE